MHIRPILMLPVVLLTAAPTQAALEDWSCSLACPPRRAFEETAYGRVNFAPPLDADFLNMRLELFIADMNTPTIEAVEHLTLTPIDTPLAEVGLDAHLLDIASVSAAGYETAFDYDGHALCVRFDPPVPVGQTVTLTTTYTVNDPPYGLIWTPESAAFPGRAAQIHTQGEPETNSYWFPCHDFPNDRLTTEVVVTLPQGYQVLSNGRLVERDVRSIKASRVGGEHDLVAYNTYHWSQDEAAGGAHVPYLMTMVIGKFDVVDVGTKRLPMPVYVPRGRGKDVRTTYGRTGAMVKLFEGLFDEPYPWSKYAQAVVWNFGAGGMENTSATTMFDAAIYSQAESIDQDYDGLIAHELGHQWFGDLITCDTWEHIWLNEGFATYLAALWFGQRDGLDGYYASMQRNFDNVVRGDTGTAPGTPAMVSPVYDHPWEVFRRGANPYPKGASILHMLRQRFGDKQFFGSIADYLDEHRLTTAVTTDLQAAFENRTGASLDSFFSQWAYRPGIPRVTIETFWDEAAGTLTLTAEQTQTIDADNPAFVIEIPVQIRMPGSKRIRQQSETLRMDGPKASLTIPLTTRPDLVVFNPELSVLAELNIQQATVLWIEQLASGPTLAAKIQAARALANEDGVAGARLLYATALDNGIHEMLRVEAVKALAAQGDLSRVFFLMPTRQHEYLGSPAARAAALEALGRMGYDHPQGSTGKSREQIAATLMEYAAQDPSTTCRAAAIKALGTMKAVEAAVLVRAATSVESPRDAIRVAALETLGAFNMPEALPVVLRHAYAGSMDRTRPAAIGAAMKLRAHDEAAVKAMLADAVFDRNRRASEAAAERIAEIGGDWAVELLTRRAESLRDPQDVQKIEELRKKAAGSN